MQAVPGLSREEVVAEFPWAVPQPDWKTGGWNQLPGHETRVQAIPRADRVWQSLQAAAAEVATAEASGTEPMRWLLVSHGEFIALLLSRCLTGRDDYFVRPRSLYNTSITKLLITPQHCRLLEFNQIAHLSPAAISS
jgi:broad specificity phosphatase PhoE